MIKSKRIACYIDGRRCTGARFCFCEDCKKAQHTKNYEEKIGKANTPVKLSMAHIPKTEK